MQTVYVAGGNVGMSQLISGEIQDLAGVAVMSTTSAATEYQIVRPIPNASTAIVGTWATSETSLGVSGQVGDYLAGLEIQNADALNAAVFLEDGNLTAAVTTLAVSLTGSSTTALAAPGTSVTVASASSTITLNQFAGHLLAVTYIPTAVSGGVAVKFLRKIVSHAAFTTATALTFVVTHDLPIGAAGTFWEVLPLSAYEVQPFNTPAGARHIPMGRVSTYGAWRVSVDSAVQVVASGIFSG